MTRPSVWIDADSCPRSVRSYVIKRAVFLSVKVIFVANHEIPAPAFARESGMFSMAVCGKARGEADRVILDGAREADIVVTRDVPLAVSLARKGVAVMNDRGTLFTKENAAEKLKERDFDFALSQIGFAGAKKSSYGKKELAAFSRLFDKAIEKALADSAKGGQW